MSGNREYKSDVFCMLMQDKERALQLYNAMNGSCYSNPDDVEMTTHNGGISLSVRNDASFVVDARLSIYEHQSTVCPNMPIRSIIYFSVILSDMLSDKNNKKMSGKNIYGRKLVKIPTPHFVVFYNGEEEQPEIQELRLSDSYEKYEDDPDLELKCKVYNINAGKNRKILETCNWLDEYMIFVNKVREYHNGRTMSDLEEDINRAIDYCIKHDILSDFLSTYRSEVTNSMQLNYEFDRQLELERADAREDGYEEGREAGMKDGMEAGMEAGRKAGMEAGRAEGIEEERKKTILSMYNKGYSTEQIADVLEMSAEQIDTTIKNNM